MTAPTLTVPLATSRYQNYTFILDSGLVPVRTTLGAPRFKLRYSLGGHLKLLTPSRAIFGIQDLEEFDQAYRAQLDAAGIDAIANEIAQLSGAHDGAGLALLCFEDVQKDGELACHRRSFARWWEERTGQCVPELEEPPVAPAEQAPTPTNQLTKEEP